MTISAVQCLLAFSLFFSIGIASVEAPAENPSPSSGHKIFDSNCASCHGVKGDVSALKGAFNFTDNELMTTKNSSVFFNAVTNGVPGTAMPSFDRLPMSQRWDVVSYLWMFWLDNASVGRGKNIYQKNCNSCHGNNGDGSGISGAFDFTNMSVMVLAKPEIFFKSVTDGVNATAMPSFKDSLSEDERWDAVKYAWTFQFKDSQTILKTQSPEISLWYLTPAGIGILVISIILAGAVMYLFGKGMQER